MAGVGLRENEVDGHPQVHLCQQLVAMAALQAGGVILDEPDERMHTRITKIHVQRSDPSVFFSLRLVPLPIMPQSNVCQL